MVDKSGCGCGIIFWVVIVIFIFITAYSEYGLSHNPIIWDTPVVTKKENISRVFMNKVSDYTLFFKYDDRLLAFSIVGAINIYTDVPPDKPMYLVTKEFKNLKAYNTDSYPDIRYEHDIHIHSAADLNGGEWSERTGGKYPKTITGKVQEIK